MGLSYDEYKKMKDEGRIRWDTDAINKARTDIGQFLSGVDSQMKALGMQWTPEEFTGNQSRIADFKDSLQYMQGYMNSIRNSDREGYEQLRAQHDELSKLLSGAENWFTKNTDEEKRNYWYETAQSQRKQAADAVNTAKAVSDIKQGKTTAADAAAEYGLDEKELQKGYDELRAHEKQADRESKYGGMGYDELVGLLKSPESLGQRIYNEIRDEYGAYLKDYSEFDRNRVFESRAEKYGLSADEVKKIYEESSERNDHKYDSAALSDADKAYVAQRIIETGTADQLRELKKTLPAAKYYDALRYQLNQAIEKKSEEESYLNYAKNDPRITQVMEKIAAIDRELPGLASTTGAPAGKKGQFSNIMDAQETRAAYMRELEARGYNAKKMVKYYKRYRERMKNEENQKAVRDWTSQNGFNAAIASIGSVPINMIGSLGDALKIALANLSGDGWYDPKGTANYTAQNIRNTTTEMIDEATKDSGAWNYWAKQLYSAGMSTGDMVLAAAANAIPVVGQAASNAMFFSSAGVNAANEVIENGGDLGQATAAMIASGGAELLFERISLDKLKEFAVSGNVTDANEYFKGLLKQAFVEGSEEFNTTLANTFADALINGGNNSVSRRIRQLTDSGIDAKTAENTAWQEWGQQIIDDAVGGALTGGVLGAAAGARNALAVNKVENVGGQALTRGELAALLDSDNSTAMEAAQKIVKDRGVDAVLEAAKNSVDAQTRKTAEHFADLSKKGKLDEKDAAQLFVKVVNEQAAVDSIAQITGAETLSEHRERQEQTGREYAAFDYAGNKQEKGQYEINSSFGAAHKNGLAATDRNGKAVVVLGIESSEAEYGREDNTVSVRLNDGSIVDAASVAIGDEAYSQLLTLAAAYDTLGARALTANYESAKENGMSLDDYKGAFNALYEAGSRGVSFESAAKNPQMLSVIRGMGETAARGAIEAGLNDRDISVRTQRYLLKKVRAPKVKSTAESRVYAERGVLTDGKSEVMDLLQTVAEKTGKEIVLTDALDDDENGVYAQGRIYINAERPDHVIFTTALHEATHNARVYDPEGFRALEKFVVNYLTEQGKDVDKMLTDISAVWGKDAPTAEVQMEELICKTVEALAADENALKIALDVKKNQSILKKVGDALKRIADRVMKFFKGDGELAAHNAQAQAFIDDHKALEHMAELCSQMFDEARENERKFGGRESEERFAKTSKKGDSLGRFSQKTIDDYTERQYNNYGWAIVNSVISGKELTKLFSQFADKETLNSKFKKSFDDFYMIPVGKKYSYNDKIVFIAGSNQHPIIDRILKVNGKSEAVIGFCLQEVIDSAGQHDSLDYLGEIAGERIFEQYTSADFKAYGTIKEERERYNRESASYTNENGERKDNTQKHNGFVKNIEKNSVDFENEFNDPNARKSKDDAIYDSAEIEDLFDDYEDSGMLDEVDPNDPYGRTTGQIIDDELDMSRGKGFDVGKYMNAHTPTETVMVIYDAMAKTAERGIKGFDSVKLGAEDYLRIARRVMNHYGIKERLNRGLAGEIAGDIEQFVKDVKDFKKGDFSTFINALVTKCRKYLEHSGDYQFEGAYEDAAKQIKSYLRGGTLMITPYAQSEVLDRYDGDVKKLRQALKGYVHVGFEKDRDRYQRPIYMDDLLDFVSDLTTNGDNLGDFSFLFPDGERPDSLEAWGWLVDLLKNRLQPTFVNPYYDGYNESIDSAALEMAFEIATDIVSEKGERAKAEKNADKKQLREIDKENRKAQAERDALHKAKAEELNRKLERARSRYEREHGLRELAEEDLATLKAFVRSDTKNFREQYAERQRKNAVMRRLGRKLDSLTKRLDGKANKNEYIPETLKKPLLDVLELFKADPGQYKNGRQKSEPSYFGAFRELTKVKDRINTLTAEYAKLEGETDFKDALGFDINALNFDKGILNELKKLSDYVGEKNVYQLDSGELEMIAEVLDDLDNQLKRAVEIIVDGKKTTIQEQTAKGIEQTEKVYYKKDSRKFIADVLKDARNRYIATSLDPVRYGKFLSGYKDGAVWNLLMNDLHSGDQKRVRIMQQAYSAVQAVTAKYSRRELNDLQRKAVDEFTMKDLKTGEDVKLSQGMLLAVYLTNMQQDGHRHLCNDLANHYTRVADLDTLNGNRVLPDVRKKQQKAMSEKSHEVRFDEATLRRITEYVESTPLLKELAGAIHGTLNGLLADEINKVSMQRSGKLIATVKNYFPLRVDQNDPNKKFTPSFEGENIFTDERMKSRGFTKQRTRSYNAIVIGDALNVFQRHVNETAEYCGLLIPVENIKKIINSDNGEITMRKEIENKFGGSAIHYLNKLLGDIQKRKDNTDENVITSMTGHAMGAALAFNPRSWLKNYGALPLANKHFGAANVMKAVAATKAGWGKTGKDLVEKYNAYTPYMWYREQGNGTIVGELSRQHGLYGKFSDAVDMMGKFDRAVVNLLLYASEQNVKQTTELKVDSEEFKQEVAKRFEKCVDESQPNSMLTSKPQFVRNDIMRVLSLNAFASQRMAMGNSLMDSFMEFRARSYENKMEGTAETKAAARKALKGFVSTFFGVLLSAGLQSLLGVLASTLIFHKWDDLKDDEGNVTMQSALLGGGKMFIKGFPEEFFGSFAWMDRAYSFVEKRIDQNAYGSDFNVMSFSAVEDIVKNIEGGNWAKAYGRFADLLGLSAFGGSNMQKLGQSGYSYINDLFNGQLGFTANNGKADFGYMDSWIIAAYDSGNKEKGDELRSMWIKEKEAKGKSTEQAEAAVDNKLIEAAAKREDVLQAAVCEANGNYKEAARIKQELEDKGLSEYVVTKAVDKAVSTVKSRLKEDSVVEFEDVEDELWTLGFNEDAAEKIAGEYMKSLDTTRGEAAEYTLTDAFNALKNGERESYELVKGYLTENGKSEEQIDKAMRSLTYTKPLFIELEDATDNGPRARLDKINQTLLNIYGDKGAVNEAYERYKKNKNK